jgi:hypothetical protein
MTLVRILHQDMRAPILQPLWTHVLERVPRDGGTIHLASLDCEQRGRSIGVPIDGLELDSNRRRECPREDRKRSPGAGHCNLALALFRLFEG